MSRFLLRWIIAGVFIAGAVVAGLTVRQRQAATNPCAGGQYGVDYDTCVQCIGDENYCASVWGGPGEDELTATPTGTGTGGGQSTGRGAGSADPCKGGQYGVDYDTCVQCIGSTSYCASVWRGPAGTGAGGDTPKDSGPGTTPTPKAKLTPTPTPTPTATPTPTPTPLVDCAGGYGHNYDECVQCTGSLSYCEALYR